MTQEGLAASTRATIVSTIRSVQPLNRALDAAVIKVPHRQVMEEVLSIPEIQKVLAYLKEKESWFYPVFALKMIAQEYKRMFPHSSIRGESFYFNASLDLCVCGFYVLSAGVECLEHKI